MVFLNNRVRNNKNKHARKRTTHKHAHTQAHKHASTQAHKRASAQARSYFGSTPLWLVKQFVLNIQGFSIIQCKIKSYTIIYYSMAIMEHSDQN